MSAVAMLGRRGFLEKVGGLTGLAIDILGADVSSSLGSLTASWVDGLGLPFSSG